MGRSFTKISALLASVAVLGAGAVGTVVLTATPASATPVCLTNTSCNIFGNAPSSDYPSGYGYFQAAELGVNFQASQSGYVTGVRFYSFGPSPHGPNPYTVSLWDKLGNLLRRATATLTPSGWTYLSFPSAVFIAANTTYVASYTAPVGGGFGVDVHVLSSAVVNPPLTALSASDSNDVAGGNGIWNPTPGNFPNSYTNDQPSFFVDVQFETPCTTDCYVDAAAGNDNNSGNPDSPLKTVQAGVNAVNPGGTVHVAAGTYDGQVNVTKSIELLGLQATNNPCVLSDPRPSGGEAVITDSTGITPLVISASDVTVDGFTVEGNTNTNLDGAGVYIVPAHHGTVFQNNIVKNNIIGLFPENDLAGDPLNVNHNRFKDNTNPGAASGADLYADNSTAGGPILGATIDSNCFRNTVDNPNGSAVILSNEDGANPFSGITISNNTIANTGLGVFFSATANSSMTGNTFTPDTTSAAGAYLCGGVDCPYANSSVKNTDISITMNSFGCAACSATGVKVRDVAATGIVVNRNDLHGLTPGIVNFEATPTVNGTCNWWGAATGPAAGQVLGPVDASIWLATPVLSGPCAGKPGAPTIGPVSDVGYGGLSVSFTPPVSNGGSPILSYTATCVSLAGQVSGSATGTGSPIVVTGLQGGTPYQCTVTATNAFGTGPPSGPSSIVYPEASNGNGGVVGSGGGSGGGGCTVTPTAPRTPSAAAEAFPGAAVSWAAPVSGCVAGYVVTPYLGGVAQTPTVIPGLGTTTVIRGLILGDTYTFTVAAENGIVTGPASVMTAAVTIGSPSAATGVHTARVAKGSVKISFAAARNNGAAIKTYTATCTSSNGGATKTKAAKTSPVTVTGLTAGKTYTCTVTATNSRGTGPSSRRSAAVKA